MQTLMWLAVIALVLVVLAAAFPPVRRFFMSLFGWGGGQLDKAAEAIDNIEPMQHYKTLIRNATDNGKNANKVVKLAAKNIESLTRQIDDDLKEKTRLENRIATVTANGDPNKTARKYALDLARLEENLARNQEQLATAQETYDENLKLVEKYERDIAEAHKDAAALNFQLEQTAAESELYEMNVALRRSLNTSDLAQARQRVQDKIDAQRGEIRANRDLSRQGMAEDADDELERQEAADAILARFQKKDAPQG